MAGKKLNKWIKYIIFIIALIISVNFLEIYGFIGFIIFILIFVGYRIYTRKSQLDVSMGNIESMIFGKPLKKELWDKGELKNTQIKIGVGKSKTWDVKLIINLFWVAMFGVVVVAVIFFLRR